MNPFFKPVENPALLPVVVKHPQLLSADFDGDSPNGLISPYDPLCVWVMNHIVPGMRAIVGAFRDIVTSHGFKVAVAKARKQKRLKNQRRRRKTKAMRKK
ncbi:hypothetical protein pEaSNUABM38_00177 [Erwinia phage pEa_SNUABM_38]|nr:hypothetical protein pEaSNUABM38_00177 [Erwinia phage pEa_SNUABM_38]